MNKERAAQHEESRLMSRVEQDKEQAIADTVRVSPPLQCPPSRPCPTEAVCWAVHVHATSQALGRNVFSVPRLTWGIARHMSCHVKTA